METYLLGLATLPVLGVIVWGAVLLYGALDRWWCDWNPRVAKNYPDRLVGAACTLLARRFLHIPLPGGVAIIYRSKVHPSVPHYPVMRGLEQAVKEWQAKGNGRG
jgi:hypothetical protein